MKSLSFVSYVTNFLELFIFVLKHLEFFNKFLGTKSFFFFFL